MSVNVNQVKSIGGNKFKIGSERITPVLPSIKRRNWEKKISIAASIIIVRKSSFLFFLLLKKVFQLILNDKEEDIYQSNLLKKYGSICRQVGQSCLMSCPHKSSQCLIPFELSISDNRIEAPGSS